MTEPEPIYTYVKGQGWQINPFTLREHECPILDFRNDKTKPGVWTLQIWLVGLPTYSYTDWLDNWADSLFASIESIVSYVGGLTSHWKLLFSQGAKQRIVRLDYNGQGWWPVKGDYDAYMESL